MWQVIYKAITVEYYQNLAKKKSRQSLAHPRQCINSGEMVNNLNVHDDDDDDGINDDVSSQI